MHKISTIISFIAIGLTFSTTLVSADRILKLDGPVNFGTVASGDSVTQNLIIKNMGSEALGITKIRFHENLDDVYTGSWTGAIPAGGQHSVPITFTPTENRDYRGSIYVESNRTNTGVDRDTLLIGTGTSHIIPCTGILKMGKHLNFDENWTDATPSVAIGDSKTISLTLSNKGWCPLTITGLKFHKNIADEYSGNWSGTILPGQSQNVNITFTPTATAPYTGLVYVKTADRTNIQNSSDNNRLLVGEGTTAFIAEKPLMKSN